MRAICSAGSCELLSRVAAGDCDSVPGSLVVMVARNPSLSAT